VTDPNGNVTNSSWDAARRLATTTLPVAPGGLVTANGSVLRTTRATYAPSGKPGTVTDAEGNVGRFAYDQLDRQVIATDALYRVTTQTYDALSQPWQAFKLAVQAAALLTRSYAPDGLPAGLTDAKGSSRRRKVKEGESDTSPQIHTAVAAGGHLGIDELFARASQDARYRQRPNHDVHLPTCWKFGTL
jgi:YD repeat-containing protein